MNAQDILLKHVCPGVGVGIAFILFMSPLPAVLRCNKGKCLGVGLPVIVSTAAQLLSSYGSDTHVA